jgi:hypothetical protein
MGWYITQGAVPYVHIWDVKPPLVPETATVFAILGGGSPMNIYYIAVGVMCALSIGISLLVGNLTFKATQNGTASYIAGVAVFAHPAAHLLPTHGLWGKYFALFLGLLGIWLVFKERPLLAGLSAAASGGYWQFGLIFSIIVVGLTLQNHRATLKYVISGMALAFVVTISPIVYWGATLPMIEEVVLFPLLIDESYSMLHRLGKGVLYLGFASLTLVLGTIGILWQASEDLKRDWWVTAGLAWFAIQLLFLNFSGPPDLFPALLFTAIGIGILADRLELAKISGRKGVNILVGAVVLTSVIFHGSFGILVNPMDPAPSGNTVTEKFLYSQERNVEGENAHKSLRDRTAIPVNQFPSMEKLYWNKIKPKYCHYRLSGYELLYLQKTNTDFRKVKCGPDSVKAMLKHL